MLVIIFTVVFFLIVDPFLCLVLTVDLCCGYCMCRNVEFLRFCTCGDELNWFLGFHCTSTVRAFHSPQSLSARKAVVSNSTECLLVILKVIKH